MRITALTLSAFALVLFACSSESPTGSTKSPTSAPQNDDDDDDTKAPSNASNTGASTGTGSSSDPTDPAPAGGGQCASQAKAQACFDCCDPTQSAFDAADQAFGDCICAAAKCGTACAQTACNAANPTDPQQGDACDTCLQQQSDACDQLAGDVCDKDANCKSASACVEAAKCFDKPE